MKRSSKNTPSPPPKKTPRLRPRRSNPNSSKPCGRSQSPFYPEMGKKIRPRSLKTPSPPPKKTPRLRFTIARPHISYRFARSLTPTPKTNPIPFLSAVSENPSRGIKREKSLKNPSPPPKNTPRLRYTTVKPCISYRYVRSPTPTPKTNPTPVSSAVSENPSRGIKRKRSLKNPSPPPKNTPRLRYTTAKPCISFRFARSPCPCPCPCPTDKLFMLYIMHVPSYFKCCRKGAISNHFPSINIHALIPQFRKQLWVPCPPELDFLKFDREVTSQLCKHWINVEEKGKNEDFWKREWMKHGLSQNTLAPEMYFKLALRVYKKVPIMRWLNEEGILPGPEKEYYAENVKKAVEKHLTHRIGISCQPDVHRHLRIVHYAIFCNEFGDLRDKPWDSAQGRTHYYKITLEDHCKRQN